MKQSMVNTHRPTVVSEHMVKILNTLYRKTLVVLEKGIAGNFLYLLYKFWQAQMFQPNGFCINLMK